MKDSRLRLTLLCVLLCVSTASAADSYYSEPALVSTRPSAEKSLVTIDRFGPVGMSLELIQPAFTMRVGKIEEGSPAAATGQLKKGQIIESINGEALADIDPRVQLANMITEAEAGAGKLRLTSRGEAEPVTVQLPVLGAYSETWPVNCPKSDKIVRNMADYLKQPDANRGISDIGMIFLLSTGNEEDLEFVGEWARKMEPSHYAWYLGFAGIPLCATFTAMPGVAAILTGTTAPKWVSSIMARTAIWPLPWRPQAR